MARSLPPGRVGARVQAWNHAVASSDASHRILDLYSGDTWSQVKRLLATADEMGYQPEVRVASAGLGLRSLDDRAPAYAATFAVGHQDSVASSANGAKEWWSALPKTSVQKRGRAMWVLSQTYSRVIGSDLLQASAPSDLLVFGGTSGDLDDIRIPADRSLRHALGGTMTSFNVRAAVQWLRISNGEDPFSANVRKRWRRWCDEARKVERYDRQLISDATVVAFVTKIKQDQPGISKTRALRALRDSGLACEQHRFSNIFQRSVTS